MAKRSSIFRFIIGVTALLMLGVTISAQEGDDSVSFPELTGEYQVGVTQLHLVDDSREEIFTEDEGDMRELIVDIYYPAEPTDDSVLAPYFSDIVQEAYEMGWQVDTGTLDALPSFAYQDAPVADAQAPYPVVFFSPGMGNPTFAYQSLVQDVASHGYVVVSMNHPYTSGLVAFPDGRIATPQQAGFVFINQEGYREQADTIGAVWAGDVIYTLNTLEGLTTDDLAIVTAMDFERVGMFGHSFGGATATQVHYLDDRFNAAINIDGNLLYGEVVTEGLDDPFMFMLSIPPERTDEQLEAMGQTREQIEARQETLGAERASVLGSASTGYQFTLLGSAHNTYTTDFNFLISALPGLSGFLGETRGEEAVSIIRDYVREFFDVHLKGMDATLLTNSTEANALVELVFID